MLYYVDPFGGGSGQYADSPIRFADLWPRVAPGDVALVLDGRFTGPESMIDNSSARHGASGAPIRISAINPGKVFIDGQDRFSPVNLKKDWYELEGINAFDSSSEVYRITGSRNKVRRCGGWNANQNDNVAVCSIFDGNQYSGGGDIGVGNLVEDFFGFGTGRKILTSSAGASYSTFRRCFAMVQGSNSTAGPRCAIDIGYDAVFDTAENCITMINRDRSFNTPYEDIGSLQGIGRTITGRCARHTSMYGCIGVLLGGQSAYDTESGLFVPLRDNAWFEYVDSLIYIEPGTHREQAAFNIQPWSGGGESGCGPINPSPGQRQVIRAANIGGNPAKDSLADDVIYRDFYQSPDVQSLYGAESLYRNSGNKPTVRYRYVDRQLTSEELWPWPMNQRIIDAMRFAGRNPVDINATTQAIFGPFPPDSPDPIPPDPVPVPVVFVKQVQDANGHLWQLTNAQPYGEVYLDGTKTQALGRDLVVAMGIAYVLGDTDNNWYWFNFSDSQWHSSGPTLPAPSPPTNPPFHRRRWNRRMEDR